MILFCGSLRLPHGSRKAAGTMPFPSCSLRTQQPGNTQMGRHDTRATYVIGPNGTVLTFSSLPSPKTRRWVARRKAEVVAAVCGGLLTLDEACERYAMTVEEFAE